MQEAPPTSSCSSGQNAPLVDFLVNAIRALSASQLTAQAAQTKYHMVRQSIEGSGTVILFYIIKQGEQAALCLVGTDPKATGHFTYRSHPNFPLPNGVLPHRSTNRSAAISFLASLGAKHQIDGQINIPPLPADQIEALTRNDPLFSRPISISNQSFTSWKEVNGLKCSDGRSLKQFYLVDDRTGSMKLAINAEDSHRRDRRYTYVTTPEFGSLKLENGAATRNWFDMCLDSRGAPNSSNASMSLMTQAPPSTFVMSGQQHTSDSVRNHLMMNQLDSIYLDFVLNEPSLAESERLMSWIDSIEQSQSQSQSLNRIHVDLGEILLFPISLPLLMDTSVVSAMKILSRHTDPSISSMSKQILSRWRALVENVLRVCA